MAQHCPEHEFLHKYIVNLQKHDFADSPANLKNKNLKAKTHKNEKSKIGNIKHSSIEQIKLNVDSMSTQCRPKAEHMPAQYRLNVDTMSIQCQHNVDTMSTQCRHDVDPNVDAMSTQCRFNVDAMSTQCRLNVALMSTQC